MGHKMLWISYKIYSRIYVLESGFSLHSVRMEPIVLENLQSYVLINVDIDE